MRTELAYTRALVGAAPLADLALAVVRRIRRPSLTAVLEATEAERRLAADALGRAPRLFTTEPLGEAYRQLFPDSLTRIRSRAEQILEHQVELFGRPVALGTHIDWLRDPLSDVRFDGTALPEEALASLLTSTDGDPKAAWELARGAHLIELGAASRLCRDLEVAARAEIRAQMTSFLDQVPVGRGFHYASPLEVALRDLHWLQALELAGGARQFPRPFIERLAGALLGDARFLATHLEDSGAVPANHLLGDWVGLYVLGLALDGSPGMRALRLQARAGIEREASRQVGDDGAHFEASTAYHRFALELLLVAQLFGRSAGARLDVGEAVHAMLRFVRGILQPDGTDPGFGDSDDARLFPLVPRDPHEQRYLLPVGVALYGDPALRPIGVPFAEEALWLFGPEAHRTWQWVTASPETPAVSFPSGGVHVLRDRDIYVALRSGSYGQHGVGGHAHNDQLSLVVHAGGRPLIVDAGTGCYTQDLLMRDRFRGTAAHSTVVVDGEEQAPIFEGHPFALPDLARASRVRVEDVGSWAQLEASHQGYRRLPARVTHHRLLTLHRVERVLIIEDRLEGRGEVAADVRFLLGGKARLGATPSTRSRLRALERLLGPVNPARVIEIEGRAALVPLDGNELELRLDGALVSPRFRTVQPATLVSESGRLTLSKSLRHGMIFLDRT